MKTKMKHLKTLDAVARPLKKLMTHHLDRYFR